MNVVLKNCPCLKAYFLYRSRSRSRWKIYPGSATLICRIRLRISIILPDLKLRDLSSLETSINDGDTIILLFFILISIEKQGFFLLQTFYVMYGCRRSWRWPTTWSWATLWASVLPTWWPIWSWTMWWRCWPWRTASAWAASGAGRPPLSVPTSRQGLGYSF